MVRNYIEFKATRQKKWQGVINLNNAEYKKILTHLISGGGSTSEIVFVGFVKNDAVLMSNYGAYTDITRAWNRLDDSQKITIAAMRDLLGQSNIDVTSDLAPLEFYNELIEGQYSSLRDKYLIDNPMHEDEGMPVSKEILSSIVEQAETNIASTFPNSVADRCWKFVEDNERVI